MQREGAPLELDEMSREELRAIAYPPQGEASYIRSDYLNGLARVALRQASAASELAMSEEADAWLSLYEEISDTHERPASLHRSDRYAA